MYQIVKTVSNEINGITVWVEVKTIEQTLAGNIQHGTTICEALNATCEPNEAYHLRQA